MKKMFNKVLLSASVLGLLAGCAGEEDNVIMAPVPQVKNQLSSETQWSASIGSGVGDYFSQLTPNYNYDKVFVADRDGLVKALDPKTGDTLWETDLEGDTSARLSGGIAAAYGQIYIGSENGRVIALDEKTGKQVWSQPVDGEVLATPATDSNLVLVNTSRGTLIALDQKTGKQEWVINTEVPTLTLRGDSQPVAFSGGVFWGTPSGRLAAAVVERGQLIWQHPIGKPKGATEIDRLVDVDSSPLLVGSTLYTVGYNGQLVAMDLRSGNPIWKRNYSSSENIATDGSSIFLVTDNDHLVAVDARSGTELWKNNKLENRLVTAPVMINGYVVVGDSQGYLYWIDRETGKFVAEQNIDSSGLAISPITVDNGYVVVTRDGSVKKLTIKQ
ncbi:MULTISPECIES: outer membrane protein assembly factor BamB [Vibrio]|uniref:Outer membrane protein assembly factor BamB n=2 Tax=Vibrio TaxID=662 RepID=A0A7X4LLU3_9VIBR|nr:MULTISPECIES: outer membrane protein assembly factor BamB [Vibrio]MBF8999129.1 outer membrane protein assembly factor BamB [Vibrio nitrifigilis]MZI94338.1 outer membrane protein assembly factor BamB [Vibrio eleionomae]